MRNKNPFNIKDSTFGKPIGFDDEGHAKFNTLQEGIDAGLEKLKNIYAGKSSTYSPDDTLEQFAKKYSENPAHADSLSKHLGLPKTTKIKDIPILKLAHAILKQEDYNLYKNYIE